jgi:hypothetical protein
MSPSDDDYDQETDPRANRAGREIAGVRGPAWDPQLSELQCAGAYDEQDAARQQLHRSEISNSQQAAYDKIRAENSK